MIAVAVPLPLASTHRFDASLEKAKDPGAYCIREEHFSSLIDPFQKHPAWSKLTLSIWPTGSAGERYSIDAII